MEGPPPYSGVLFQDAIICGMIGGAVASLLGETFVVWAMLGAVSGPVVTLAVNRLIHGFSLELTGGTDIYEFGAFALCAAVAILAFKLLA